MEGQDSDGDSLAFTITQGPTKGSLSGTVPNVTYTPAADFNGMDSLTFTVSDGVLTSEPAAVTLSVTAVNDPPVVDPLPDLTVAEDAGAQSLLLTGIAPGPATAIDEGAQAVTVMVASSNPALIPVPTVSGAGSTRTMTYQPVPDGYGTATLTVTATDGAVGEEATFARSVTITVTPVNDLPTAGADALVREEEVGETLLAVLANDTSAPDGGEALTITGVGAPDQGGVVTIAPDNQGLLYRPAANFSGTETFSYTVNDGTPGSDAMGTVTVTVTPINDPPTASNIHLAWDPSTSPGITEQRVYRSTTEGGPYTLVATIPNGTPSFFTDTNLPSNVKYYYVVRAFDGQQESPKSNEVSAVSTH